MTDARLPERWLMDRRIVRLSDGSFRDFTVSLLWSVSNRTDGQIDREDLGLIPGFRGVHVADYVERGLWHPTGSGWQIVDFASTQSSKSDLEVLEHARKVEREKKARQRAARKGESQGTVPGDVSPGTAQARQERQEQARISGEHANANYMGGPVPWRAAS